MFTVMHNVGGVDTFYTAYNVERVGPHADQGQECIHIALKETDQENGTQLMLTGGTVFVMNEAGATVAKYHLPEDRTVRAEGQ